MELFGGKDVALSFLGPLLALTPQCFPSPSTTSFQAGLLWGLPVIDFKLTIASTGMYRLLQFFFFFRLGLLGNRQCASQGSLQFQGWLWDLRRELAGIGFGGPLYCS